MQQGFLVAAVLAAAALTTQFQEPERIPNMPRAVPTARPSSNDAVALALADARTLSPVDAPFMRYCWATGWLGDGDAVEDGKAISFVGNTTATASIIVRPTPLGREKLVLMRIDLRSWFPREQDLKTAIVQYDTLEFDPAFALLITKGTIKAALVQFPTLKGKAVAIKGITKAKDKAKAKDKGKEKDIDAERDKSFTPEFQAAAKAARDKANPPAVKSTKREEVTLSQVNVDDIDLLKFVAPHLDQAAFAELQVLTATPAPIFTAEYFTYRTLSTVQDAGVYQIIFGGIYYDVSGIRKVNAKGNDEDNLLEALGVGNVAQGVNAAKVFDALRSDRRTAIFRSNVTAMPRRVDVLPILVGDDGEGGTFRISHDPNAPDIDVDTHPLFSLIPSKDFDFAREAIWTRQNGLMGYAAIAAATGNLVDEVPFSVAIDHTIPAPHIRRLQAAISCIACHQGEGSDGYREVGNDVLALVNPKTGKLDIFGDVDSAELNKPIADTLDRIAGLYQGKFDRAFRRGRDNYSAAVLKATGPVKGMNAGGTDVVRHVAQRVVGLSRNYYLDLINAQQALKEMGLDSPKGKDADETKKWATELFAQLVPVDYRAAVEVPFVAVIVPEDVRIAALRAGLSITRADWDLVRAFAQERLQTTLARQAAQQRSSP